MKKIKNMKIKKLMYLSAFMFFWLLPAQTHRYIYELKYKLDSTQAEHSKRLMVLDINPKAEVEVRKCFFLPENADEFNFEEYSINTKYILVY